MEELIAAKSRRKQIAMAITNDLAKCGLSVSEAMAVLEEAKTAIADNSKIIPITDSAYLRATRSNA